jgi:orotate phosphoribosyltransferase
VIPNFAGTLYEMGAIQFGAFKLKSGAHSPVYIDLRRMVSDPHTLMQVAGEMVLQSTNLTYQRIAGIPTAGLPLGTALSITSDRPLIYPRMEAKGYGTAQRVEGLYREGETVLVVDDVISLANSKLEAIVVLESAGLVVKDVMVVVDRQMGGADTLAEKGYTLHALYTLTDLLDSLVTAELINPARREEVLDWLEQQRHA